MIYFAAREMESGQKERKKKKSKKITWRTFFNFKIDKFSMTKYLK